MGYLITSTGRKNLQEKINEFDAQEAEELEQDLGEAINLIERYVSFDFSGSNELNKARDLLLKADKKLAKDLKQYR